MDFESSNKIRKQLQGANKRIMQKQVIHAVFEEASSLVDDAFWVSALQMAARGKFPKHFMYKDQTLYYRGNKTSTTSIPDVPAEAAETFIGFLQSIGILSDTDIEQHNQQYTNSSDIDTSPPSDWSGVSKKVAEIMKENYVNSMTRIHNLDKEQVASLRSVITIGFVTKIFTKKQITIKGYEIVSIEGIEQDEEGLFKICDRYWRKVYDKVKFDTITIRNESAAMEASIGSYRGKSRDFDKEWGKHLALLEKPNFCKKEPSYSFQGTLITSSRTSTCERSEGAAEDGCNRSDA